MFRAPLRPLALAAPLVLAAGLAACSSAEVTATVTVTAGTGTCEVSPTSVAAGTLQVTATYTGEGTGEVYLYGKDGEEFTKILGEVEDLTTSAKSFTADVSAGTYEIKCEGGGQEQRVPLTVTG